MAESNIGSHNEVALAVTDLVVQRSWGGSSTLRLVGERCLRRTSETVWASRGPNPPHARLMGRGSEADRVAGIAGRVLEMPEPSWVASAWAGF